MSKRSRTSEYRKAWWVENKERLNKRRNENRAKNRDAKNTEQRARYAARPADQIASTRVYMRNYGLKRRFGLTLEEWQKRFDDQGQRCACCGATESGRFWHTDHDHDTGAVRGIICVACNTTLGRLGDRLAAVQKACAMFETYLRGAEPVYRNPAGEICKEDAPGARLAIWEPKKKAA